MATSPIPYTLAGGRTLKGKLGEHPSLWDYQGKPNSVTAGFDNGPALIAALNDLRDTSGGGHLFIPPGVWGVSDAIQVAIDHSNIRVYGVPGATQIKRLSNITAGKGMIDISAPSFAFEDIYLEGATTTAVQLVYGLSGDFGQDPMNAQLIKNSSIYIRGGANNVTIRGVSIAHTGGYGIIADAKLDWIEGLKIDGATFVNCHPFSFGNGTVFGGAWPGGIFLRADCSVGNPYAIREFEIVNCRFSRVNGNCIWFHSPTLSPTAHFSDGVIDNNRFLDTGTDCIEIGNCVDVEVTSNVMRRIGYKTTDDTTAGVPFVPPGGSGVGIDTSGYARGCVYADNSILNFVISGIDGDGFQGGEITGNSIEMSVSGSPEYAQDSVSSMPSGGAATRGINMGNTNQNGGSSDNLISDNNIKGTGLAAIAASYAKSNLININKIVMRTGATEPPVILYSARATAAEFACFGNTVEDNQMTYDGNRRLVEEQAVSNAAGNFLSTDINIVRRNRKL